MLLQEVLSRCTTALDALDIVFFTSTDSCAANMILFEMIQIAALVLLSISFFVQRCDLGNCLPQSLLIFF